MNADAMLGVPRLPRRQRIRFVADGDNLLDRECVFFGERKIALVVSGHAHYRTVAVTPQYVVADPYFGFFAGQRMHDKKTRRQTLLFHRREIGLDHAAALALVDERRELGIVAREPRRERMLGGNRHESDTHD